MSDRRPALSGEYRPGQRVRIARGLSGNHTGVVVDNEGKLFQRQIELGQTVAVAIDDSESGIVYICHPDWLDREADG